MKKKNRKSTDRKMCPYFEEKCLGEECARYHVQFEKCGEEIRDYNLFKLTEALNNFKPITE